jgi:hypothetical protein
MIVINNFILFDYNIFYKTIIKSIKNKNIYIINLL